MQTLPNVLIYKLLALQMKIILVGYMGAGKSTIAALLAQQLALPHIDLDQRIEEQEGKSINLLFDTKGEIYFRKLEHKIFHDLVSSEASFVLSTGGGTPCYANNHLLLRANQVISIYLKTSISSLMDRISPSLQSRPLLAGKNDDDLKSYIAQHLFERSFFYHQALLSVETNQRTPEQIAAEILSLLRQKGIVTR